jgi:hypothetical protein
MRSAGRARSAKSEKACYLPGDNCDSGDAAVDEEILAGHPNRGNGGGLLA